MDNCKKVLLLSKFFLSLTFISVYPIFGLSAGGEPKKKEAFPIVGIDSGLEIKKNKSPITQEYLANKAKDAGVSVVEYLKNNSELNYYKRAVSEICRKRVDRDFDDLVNGTWKTVRLLAYSYAEYYKKRNNPESIKSGEVKQLEIDIATLKDTFYSAQTSPTVTFFKLAALIPVYRWVYKRSAFPAGRLNLGFFRRNILKTGMFGGLVYGSTVGMRSNTLRKYGYIKGADGKVNTVDIQEYITKLRGDLDKENNDLKVEIDTNRKNLDTTIRALDRYKRILIERDNEIIRLKGIKVDNDPDSDKKSDLSPHIDIERDSRRS